MSFFFFLFIATFFIIAKEGNGTPLQYSCLENPTDGGAWWAVVHGVAKSQTRLSNFTFTFHFQALEKEMATHSSVLAWRIPGMGEPGGLLSMGLHRVRYNWSDLAAAEVFIIAKSWMQWKYLSLGEWIDKQCKIICLTHSIGLLWGSKYGSIMETVKDYEMKGIIINSVILWEGSSRALLHLGSPRFLLGDAFWLLWSSTCLCCTPPVRLHCGRSEMMLPVLKLWLARPPAGSITPWWILCPTSNCPRQRICLWKTASSGKVAAFHWGNMPFAATNTDNIGEGNRKHFVASPAHVKVISQPVSPAVEGLICMTLAMLPFWKFIVSQGLCYLPPIPSFIMFSAECVNDVVRIAGKITYSQPSDFQPRDGIQVSCIAGRFFTSWATREALNNPSLHLLSTFCIFNRNAGCKTLYRSSGLV